jgi:hypothetical protein
VPPFFRDVAPAARHTPNDADAPHVGPDIATAPKQESEHLVELVRAHVGHVLGLNGDIPLTQPLSELGLDSLLAVNLANRLRESLQVPVTTAMLLKGPSITTLITELFPDAGPLRPPPAAPSGSAVRVAGDGWLIFPEPNAAASLRLFCFPFAGGGAATFRSWARHLDSRIELVAIEPPGRQTRIEEPAVRDLPTFVTRLVPFLLPFLDKPFAVYGLILPVTRADFEMSSTYRYTPTEPWDVPITCLSGLNDNYVSPENARSWSRFTKRRFQLFLIDTEHFLVVDDSRFVIEVLNRELA